MTQTEVSKLEHEQTQAKGAESVLRLEATNIEGIAALLARYDLQLKFVESDDIPGSFWGDEEAGLIGNCLYARADTPIHSILHEACHYICMDHDRRAQLDTNAEGDYDEENAVCYLQILLADQIQEMGRERMFADMDAWGYTFRLGSARNWFEQDASDALDWLRQYSLVEDDQPNFQLRQ